MRVIVTGGGTGGHLYPALSIGKALRGPEYDIQFVGSARGPESETAPREGFPFHALPSRPLSRRPSLQSVSALAVLGWGAVRAAALLRQLRPDAVVGTGGYVSAGLVLAAALQRIPTVIHEQNAVAGRTNRLLGRVATRVAITFTESERFFPADKCVATGLPIRPEIAEAGPEAARSEFHLREGDPTMLVVGGSRGAVRLNEAVTAAREELVARGVQVVHQIGKANMATMANGIDGYHPVAYVEAMGSVLAAADFVLCRSGASTLAEIAAVGRPALLVPYPYAADDHQTANARVFVERGAGRLVPNDELDGTRLVAEVAGLLADRRALTEMRAASRAMGRPDAAAKVAELVRGLLV